MLEQERRRFSLFAALGELALEAAFCGVRGYRGGVFAGEAGAAVFA